jgi:hypothetical protein
MTLCPVALAVGCKKCPIFGICPAKSVIGDYEKPSEEAPDEKQTAPRSRKAKTGGKRGPSRRGRS